MPLDPDKLMSLRLPDTEQRYTAKDVMLYALGVGLGHDPLDARELAFVYEKNLKVLPTFPVVLGFDPFLLRDIEYRREFRNDGAWRGASHPAPSTRNIRHDSSRATASLT